MTRRLDLTVLPATYTVARLDPSSPIPAWADGEGFVSISRTKDELSIVCVAGRVPTSVRQDGPWSCLKLEGPFAFDETGIVLSIIRPLSEDGIGVFVVSTFDGDHVLVKQADLERTCLLLTMAGHRL